MFSSGSFLLMSVTKSCWYLSANIPVNRSFSLVVFSAISSLSAEAFFCLMGLRRLERIRIRLVSFSLISWGMSLVLLRSAGSSIPADFRKVMKRGSTGF